MNEGILISPGPREYSNYSEQEKRKKTEEFYREMEEIYNEIDGTKPKYLSRINGLFKEKYKVSELVAVLKEKDAQFLCAYSYDFFILRLLCNIAEMEEQFGECSVFRNVQSIEEIVNKQQKCIFLLRRFEMDWEEDEELLVLMQRGDVSYILLAELVGTDMIVRKVHTGCRVAKYLFDNGLKREAILFLVWLEQRLPYSDRKIMHFAMTFLDMGNVKLAYETLSKHRNPNNDILDLQNTLRDAL